MAEVLLIFGAGISSVSALSSLVAAGWQCTDGTFDVGEFDFSNNCVGPFMTKCEDITEQDRCDRRRACQWDVGGEFCESLIERSCERARTSDGNSGSLGPCNNVNDVKPIELTFAGTFEPKNPTRGAAWIHKTGSETNKNTYLMAHQSPDNYCKMLKVEVTKSGEACNYEVKEAGYTDSPTDASTCTTKAEVESHWAAKNAQTVAAADDQDGYGIKTLKYNKFCPT